MPLTVEIETAAAPGTRRYRSALGASGGLWFLTCLKESLEVSVLDGFGLRQAQGPLRQATALAAVFDVPTRWRPRRALLRARAARSTSRSLLSLTSTGKTKHLTSVGKSQSTLAGPRKSPALPIAPGELFVGLRGDEAASASS